MTRPSVAKVARLLLGFGMLTKGEQSIFIEHFNQFFVVSRKKQRQMMDQWLSECALDPVTMPPADFKQGIPTGGGRSVRLFDGIKDGLVPED
jgi:hypothetical protein